MILKALVKAKVLVCGGNLKPFSGYTRENKYVPHSYEFIITRVGLLSKQALALSSRNDKL